MGSRSVKLCAKSAKNSITTLNHNIQEKNQPTISATQNWLVPQYVKRCFRPIWERVLTNWAATCKKRALKRKTGSRHWAPFALGKNGRPFRGGFQRKRSHVKKGVPPGFGRCRGRGWFGERGGCDTPYVNQSGACVVFELDNVLCFGIVDK